MTHMETNEALLRVKHDIHTSAIYSKLDKSPNVDTDVYCNNYIKKNTNKYKTQQVELLYFINIDIKHQAG